MNAEPKPSFEAAAKGVIDLEHLDRQTMGDSALRLEVLGLLQVQIASIGLQLENARGSERSGLAHAIKGAARGTGAFALAAAADRLEAEPAVEMHLVDLLRRMREVSILLAALVPPQG